MKALFWALVADVYGLVTFGKQRLATKPAALVRIQCASKIIVHFDNWAHCQLWSFKNYTVEKPNPGQWPVAKLGLVVKC